MHILICTKNTHKNRGRQPRKQSMGKRNKNEPVKATFHDRSMGSYWWKKQKPIQSKNAANISRYPIVNMVKSLTNQQINAYKNN